MKKSVNTRKVMVEVEVHYSERDEVRLIGTNIKREDLLALHLDDTGHVVGVRAKGIGELWT